jgi:hypothetical protein
MSPLYYENFDSCCCGTRLLVSGTSSSSCKLLESSSMRDMSAHDLIPRKNILPKATYIIKKVKNIIQMQCKQKKKQVQKM